MIISDRFPASFQDLILAPRDQQILVTFGSPEYRRAEARLQYYLSLLGFNDVERARVVEQVMGRALSRGNPDRLMSEVVRGLHELLASRAQPELTTDAEDSNVQGSISWRAAARMTLWKNTGARFSSMPPMQRRSMAPEAIEYVTCRGIWRAFVAWLLGKRAPAELSFRKIPAE